MTGFPTLTLGCKCTTGYPFQKENFNPRQYPTGYHFQKDSIQFKKTLFGYSDYATRIYAYI